MADEINREISFMKLAFKRLFLIMLPLALLWIALFLSYTYPPEKISRPAPPLKNAGFWDSKCPFYLGISFFPLREKKQDFKKSLKRFSSAPWLSEKKFLQTLKKLKADLKKLPSKCQLFALPLALTKEEEWIVSKKAFFISLSGERTELSHITYESIKKLSPNSPLKLEKAFSLLPKSHFLFYLQGSNQKKIIKNLKKWQNKTTGYLYVSSLNEELLSHISAMGGKWRALHSFKTLLRFHIMSPFRLNSFQSLTGDGIYIPSVLSPSAQMLSFLKKKNKLVFFEKDPPYDLASQNLIGQAQALISSQPKLALKMAKIKKPCLIEN